jgi:hypothetical protein
LLQSNAGESQSFPKSRLDTLDGVRIVSSGFQPVRCRFPWNIG